MPTNESTAYDSKTQSLGAIPQGLITVVWTAPSNNVVRIISVRRANKHERQLYLAYNDIH